MRNREEILAESMDDAMCWLAHKMTNTKLSGTAQAFPPELASSVFLTKVRGAYDLTLMLQTDNSLLVAMAEAMAKRVLTEEEAIVYISEYFNVLCGKIVSTINDEMHVSSIFNIPEYYPSIGPFSVDQNLDSSSLSRTYEAAPGQFIQITGVYQ